MHPGLSGRSAGNREIIKDAFEPGRRQRALAYAPGNVVFTTMPKVACTSLQISFLAALGDTRFKDDVSNVHKRARDFLASDDQIANAAFTFTIHRDPFGRLASCFLDKIVRKTQKFLIDPDFARKLDPEKTTFRDFVDWLHEGDNLTANMHWRPQCAILLYKDYDKYVQFERMNEAFGALCEFGGFPLLEVIGIMPHTTHRFELVRGAGFADTPISQIRAMQDSGTCPAHDQLFDPALTARVAALYREDLERHASLFGQSALMFDA